MLVLQGLSPFQCGFQNQVQLFAKKKKINRTLDYCIKKEKTLALFNVFCKEFK